MNLTPSIVDLLVFSASLCFAYAGYLLFGLAQGMTRSIMQAPTWRTWNLLWAVPLNLTFYLLAFALMASPLYCLAYLA